MNRLIMFLCISIAFLVGCSSRDENENPGNSTPSVTERMVFLTIEKNSSLTLTTEHILASDIEGDALTLIVTGDENCSVLGTTVTPILDYVGELYLKLAVTDGNSLSDEVLMKITVLDEKTLYPLESGLWWDYSDENGSDITTSRATMGEVILVDGIAYSQLTWSTMADLNVSFLLSSDETGVSVAGGISPADTMISPVFFVPNSAELSETWSYSPIEYVKTDGAFRLSDAVTISCIATDSTLALPAGVFSCAAYQYSYSEISSRSAISGMRVYSPLRASVETTYTETLFFASNIGLVKAETATSEGVVYRKELTDWSGNQE